jgi:hypothetical protein
MNLSTFMATFFRSSAYASICWMDASTIAWNVPWISPATKDGKSMALSVARATSPTLELGPLGGPPDPGAVLPAGDVVGAAGAGGADVPVPVPELPSVAWPPPVCAIRPRRSSMPASAAAGADAAFCARTLVTVVSESASVFLVSSSR